MGFISHQSKNCKNLQIINDNLERKRSHCNSFSTTMELLTITHDSFPEFSDIITEHGAPSTSQTGGGSTKSLYDRIEITVFLAGESLLTNLGQAL
jgi:hypothetical protein